MVSVAPSLGAQLGSPAHVEWCIMTLKRGLQAQCTHRRTADATSSNGDARDVCCGCASFVIRAGAEVSSRSLHSFVSTPGGKRCSSATSPLLQQRKQWWQVNKACARVVAYSNALSHARVHQGRAAERTTMWTLSIPTLPSAIARLVLQTCVEFQATVSQPSGFARIWQVTHAETN